MTLASTTTIKVVAVGSNLDEKDLFQFRLWCSFAKTKGSVLKSNMLVFVQMLFLQKYQLRFCIKSE